VVALTADHGMSDMAREDGGPRVIWLQETLDDAFGTGHFSVICPITDAFVGHHGALGGFVRVYQHTATIPAEKVADVIADIDGVHRVWTREAVAEQFNLPLDVEADFAVMGEEGTALGMREQDHDLSALHGQRLRSHGSIWEARVPLIISEPLREEYGGRAASGQLQSHQIFDFAINGVPSREQ